jgi:hypothetical protein
MSAYGWSGLSCVGVAGMPMAIRAWVSNVGKNNTIRRKTQREENRKGDLGIVTVFAFLFIIVVFLVTLTHSLELQGIGGHDFEISSAFGTRYDLTLVDFFFINVEIIFTLWTKDHNCLHS